MINNILKIFCHSGVKRRVFHIQFSTTTAKIYTNSINIIIIKIFNYENSIFIDDNFKVVTSAVNAGVGQVYWINPGRQKTLANGVMTYPTLAELVDAII